MVKSVSNVNAATIPYCLAPLDLEEGVGQVTLGYSECVRGSQAKSVAVAHILDAAELLIVAAHGLVVGLGARKPQAALVDVTLNA